MSLRKKKEISFNFQSTKEAWIGTGKAFVFVVVKTVANGGRVNCNMYYSPYII